jgi:hypothetical protein
MATEMKNNVTIFLFLSFQSLKKKKLRGFGKTNKEK